MRFSLRVFLILLCVSSPFSCVILWYVHVFGQIEDMLARLGALGSEHRRNSSLEASAQIQMDDLQAALDSLRKRLVVCRALSLDLTCCSLLFAATLFPHCVLLCQAVEGKLLGLGGLSQHGTAPGGSGALENTPTSDSGLVSHRVSLQLSSFFSP